MQQENSAGEDLAEVKQKSWEDEGTRQRKDQVISELPLIFCWYRLLVRGGEIRAASQEPPTASIVWHVVRSDFYARHTDSDMVTDKIKFREALSFSTDRQANFNFSQLRDLLPSTSEVLSTPLTCVRWSFVQHAQTNNLQYATSRENSARLIRILIQTNAQNFLYFQYSTVYSTSVHFKRST